jgi:hypothetical protein
MSVTDKHFYNEASSQKLGWEPDWFGAENFQDDLVKKIRQFQREHGMTADGLCGPSTYRRIFTQRESNVTELVVQPERDSKDEYFIIYNGEPYPIDHPTVLWDETKGLKCEYGTFSSYAGKPKRKITMFVNHWDVCLSASSCARVIAKRGISVQFCIDNDGTIYQLHDMQHAAWQAGNRAVNNTSVGVEISNAYYPKYQERYVKAGHGERPLVKGAEVHGTTLKPFLGFYPKQITALKALWRAVHNATDVPMECPTNDDGSLDTTVHPTVPSGEYKGIINHYNVTRRKIDCAGLMLDELLLQEKEEHESKKKN